MNKILLALVLLVALVAGGFLLARHETPEWTTDSPEALAALEAAQAARDKLYFPEAAAELDRALRLDPDFVAAKIELINVSRGGGLDRERLSRVIDELRHTDTAKLTPRERLIVEYYLAIIDHQHDRAGEILDRLLAEHPDDPYVVSMDCGRAWTGERLDAAEACYRRLIRLAPNQVEAQNRLGYLAMARGDFADAEQQFEVYRYIAPDQANPHDSLGELLMTVGRYDEAEREFRQAVELKPDFCNSWINLSQLALLRDRPQEARDLVEQSRAADGCSDKPLAVQQCRIEAWAAAGERRWQDVAEIAGGCPDLTADVAALALRAAKLTGRPELGDEVVGKYAGYAEESSEPTMRAVARHVTGVRALENGDLKQAVSDLSAADEAISYRANLGLFKLYNRLALAAALASAGQTAEAERLRDEVRKVNPRLEQSVLVERLARSDDEGARSAS